MKYKDKKSEENEVELERITLQIADSIKMGKFILAAAWYNPIFLQDQPPQEMRRNRLILYIA